jgi:nucleotide-binding universal stress UspA family protein
LARSDESVGAQLLEEARAISADCLVMGAYRHGDLIERILGGVTHHMLQAADIPLFLHH